MKLELKEAQAEWEVKLQELRQEITAARAQLRHALVSCCLQDLWTITPIIWKLYDLHTCRTTENNGNVLARRFLNML